MLVKNITLFFALALSVVAMPLPNGGGSGGSSALCSGILAKLSPSLCNSGNGNSAGNGNAAGNGNSAGNGSGSGNSIGNGNGNGNGSGNGSGNSFGLKSTCSQTTTQDGLVNVAPPCVALRRRVVELEKRLNGLEKRTESAPS